MRVGWIDSAEALIGSRMLRIIPVQELLTRRFR